MSPKLFHARTARGLMLALIDVTHPDFAINVTDAELEARSRQFVSESTARQDVVSPAVHDALRGSMLGRGLMAASGTYLSGMNTYLLKLGPNHLGPDATPIDRRIAASFPAFVTRLRLQDISRLLADGIVRLLAPHPRRRLALVSIAGGTAADSWNALLYLQAERPHFLDTRMTTITVLDVDQESSGFGAGALAALSSPDGPLASVDVSWSHVDYNWSTPDRLGPALSGMRESNAACAVSSEGGLFEYGSDAEIIANLRHLRRETPDDAFVVGSVTRESDATRASRMGSNVAIRPRTLQQFQLLCDQAGWQLQRVLERPFSYNVQLVKT